MWDWKLKKKSFRQIQKYRMKKENEEQLEWKQICKNNENSMNNDTTSFKT